MTGCTDSCVKRWAAAVGGIDLDEFGCARRMESSVDDAVSPHQGERSTGCWARIGAGVSGIEGREPSMNALQHMIHHHGDCFGLCLRQANVPGTKAVEQLF